MTKAYEKTLDHLAALLRRKPLTARAVADAMRCSKPVAHARLRALQVREGSRAFYMTKVHESPTGPAAWAYGLR